MSSAAARAVTAGPGAPPRRRAKQTSFTRRHMAVLGPPVRLHRVASVGPRSGWDCRRHGLLPYPPAAETGYPGRTGHPGSRGDDAVTGDPPPPSMMPPLSAAACTPPPCTWRAAARASPCWSAPGSVATRRAPRPRACARSGGPSSSCRFRWRPWPCGTTFAALSRLPRPRPSEGGGERSRTGPPTRSGGADARARLQSRRDRRRQRIAAPAAADRIPPRGRGRARDNGAADPHRTLLAFAAPPRPPGRRFTRAATWKRWNPPAAGGCRKPRDGRAAIVERGRRLRRAAAMVGDYFPLGAKASMMIVTERVAPFVRPVISRVGRPLVQTDRPGTLLIGGGIQVASTCRPRKPPLTSRRANARSPAVKALFPTVAGSSGALRGSGGETEDLLPVIGPSPNAGVLHAFGFSATAFSWRPSSARSSPSWPPAAASARSPPSPRSA